ncbi:carbohydrate ABC transporter permease [bacterium]|nr:carbohydrate ABC transporter permease [bacterium]
MFNLNSGRWWFHPILIVYSLFSVFPFLWILSASFQAKEVISSDQMSIIPGAITFQNYIDVFSKTPFPKWFLNSILVSTAATVIGLFIAATAAFGFSQFRFPGRKTGLYLFLCVQMFPGAVLLLPLFRLLSWFGLLDNYLGLVIAYCTISLPFCVWMLKGFFDTIPKAIIEAASIDGLTHFQTFYKIVLPLSLPGIAVTGFFSFITAWNEFMFANTFLFDSDKMTLAVGLKTFLSEKQSFWELLSPGSVIVTLPILLFFLVAQKWLISGLTSGAVKE